MARTVYGIVRDSILAAGPQIEGNPERWEYVEQRLQDMTREEFLQAVSDAIEERLPPSTDDY